MQTMNISLPDPMKQYVEDQVMAGGYSSASEYVRDLVRADQKRQAKEELEQMLIGAINSGDPMDVTPEMIEQVRNRLRARAEQRKSVKG
ncbi:type II toxin-antitoxin system ParD family antitoxin [Edaphobacter sp. HDX4]|uniref:type II toxin-antitoxin system ParD family antitoxin n=1 Tax=Edaphobacter sp. HDX4 TaxID=2794064 RepID=UPI002FE644EB